MEVYMSKKAASTALGPATVIAMEQRFPEGTRLFDDPLALQFLPRRVRLWVTLARFAWLRDWMVALSEKRSPGVWALFPARKAFIDAKLREAIDAGMDRFVNLGAGFSTYAYRLPFPPDVTIWEVDQPGNVETKHGLVASALGAVPDNVRLVPLDFDHESLDEGLSAQGMDLCDPHFFVLEAVTQYLTAAGVRATFQFLAKAAKGSRLVFTYVRQDFLDGESLFGQQELYDKVVQRDKMWLFGLAPDHVEDFLSEYGWTVLEHDAEGRSACKCIAAARRDLHTTPIEAIVLAEKN
jgi:methyltransferase (TIGR00027 family)